MNVLIRYTLIGLIVLTCAHKAIFSLPGKSGDSNLVTFYQANRRVCDLPEKEDLSTPEAAYATMNRLSASGRSWTKAVATGNVQDALACMLPGGADYADVKEILNAGPSSLKFFFKKMWQSIDTEKPIRILGKKLIEGEVNIGWELYFKKDFTIKGRTFKRGESFEFDASLKKDGDYWLIGGI